VLLERTEELGALSAALDQARSGFGTTVLVGGEAGSGKSSLAAHFVATAAGRVLRSGCDGATTAAPLGPLMDVAGVLDVDVSAHAGEPVDRVRLFAAVRSALATEPTIWLVEDVHWADAATLELIRYLARRGEASPALLLLTFRDDELGPDHPVRVLLGELATVRGVRRVDVRPLSRAAVAELARGSVIDLDALCDRTGGNAFYVTEVLAGGDGTVPPTVRDAVLARAARLSDAAREVLDAAAVIGFHADIDVLAAVSGQPLTALDECLVAGVLRDAGAEVVFRHELAREAIAASILPGRRRALHRAAYEAIRASARADDRRLAHHAASAGDGPNVIVHAPRAATLAAALGAHREAAEHYRAALRWGHLMDDTGRADLLERLSYECYLTGQLQEASEARASELALRRASGDALRTGSALRWLSRIYWYRLRNAEAERYAREAVETLSQLPDSTELAMAYSNMAQLRMLADDTEGTQEWGNRAVELARALGDVDTEVHALNNVGTVLMIAGHERGAALLQESLDLALAHDLQEHVARAYTNLGATHVKHRRYPVGEHVLRAGIDFCADRDLDSWTSYMRGTLSILLLETGRWAEARSLAHAVATQSAATVSSVNALMVLGRLGTRTGAEPGAAAEAWAVAEPLGEPQRVLICACGMAEAAWTRGDLDDVRRRVDAVWALAVDRGGPWNVGELLWWLHRAGDTRAALGPVAEPFALMLAGDAAAAAAAWDAIGNPFWAALSRAASDDPADLRAAASGLEALGATATHAAAMRDLRRRGTSVPRGPRAGSRANPAGLTEREMEVLLVLAEGLSNAQIAARFVLSEKTVAHHVSAVLRKLQEPSRSRAVATARRKGLIDPG
jgi:DNA-binding CsgD family transcriptional regulator/tetratricopeptide (TPR) repeat protein